MTKPEYITRIAERHVQMLVLKTGMSVDPAIIKSMIDSAYKVAEMFADAAEARGAKPWEHCE